MGTGTSGGGSGTGFGNANRQAGSYRSIDGTMRADGLSSKDAAIHISAIFQDIIRRNPGYLRMQLAGDPVKTAFAAAFSMADAVQRPLEEATALITSRFNIVDGPGVMRRWVKSIRQSLNGDERALSVVAVALDNVMLKAINNNLPIFINGDLAQFKSHIDIGIFKSLSGHFLTNILQQIVLRDRERPSNSTETQIRNHCELLANHIINKCSELHFTKEHRYAALFELFDAHFDWLKSELIK